ncbi:MAG: PIN domain-containing protein [Corynebacterium sp.]|uniref:PIN domain-containing protein n=1 Tax=Corynebacterium sp. TaxID=1720 RepID=UPI0026DB405E|nr:PIN domain-containing protein [Corynebacterium sp.]MDO4762132.1 PIN domain-containing protein [Corynebacterium sp.]
MKCPSYLLDANVLFSGTLHSWVCISGSYASDHVQLYTTVDILAEAMHSYRRTYPHTNGGVISGIRERLVEALGEEAIIKDYPIDTNFNSRDPDDAHVHSALVHYGMTGLITNNVKDFLPLNHDEQLYDVYTPDEWLTLVCTDHPEAVCAAYRDIYNYRKKCKEPLDLAALVQKAGCPEFANSIRKLRKSAQLP